MPDAAAAPPPPALPPALPAAPVYGPGPAQFSPVGAFFGRVFRGDWLSSAKAAAWPSGLLLALAVALAIPSYGQDDEVVVGWSDRLRIALAMLLQALGGGFEVKATAGSSPFGSDSGSGSSGGIFGDGGYPDTSGGGSSDAIVQGGASLSLVPLTMTLLWIGAVCLGARMLRTRGAGLEAAVRLSLLVTGVVLVLGLFAQPEVAGVEVSSSPLLAALGALGISLAVSCGVLQRDDLAAWLAQRPAARSAVRALGTSVRALGAVVALCSLVGFVVYANADDVDGTALLIALPILPNIGFAVLGLSWGVPVEFAVQGQFSMVGSSTERGSFGLGEIKDVWGGGAVAGLLALGAVCALTLGVWAARRSADRREQLLAGGFSLGLILLFMGVSGVGGDLAGGMEGWGGRGTSEFAPSVPDALLFGLLWVGAATFLGPYVLKLTGRQPTAAPAVPPYAPGTSVAPYAPGTPVAPYAPPGAQPLAAPGFPAAPAAPATPGAAADPGAAGAPAPPATQVDAAASAAPATPVAPAAPAAPVTVTDPAASAAPAGPGGPPAGVVPPYAAQTHAAGAYDPHAVHLAAAAPAAPALAAERKRKVLVWTATLTVAFLIGGGATAGALIMRKDNDGTDHSQNQHQNQNKPPAASPSESPKTDPEPSQDPGPQQSPIPSASPTQSTGTGTLPAGFVLKQDPAGFSVGVMDGWSRRQTGSQIFYEAPTGGEYLQIGIVKNTPMSSYENFLGLEQKHLGTPETQYERSQLIQNTYQGRPGALWEFTHIPEPDEGTLKRHVIDQAFVAADGTEYAILAAGRAELWDANKDVVFSTALNTFKAG
ncbi:hypothetical protein ACQEVG_22595 [Streptomyces sp. CA-135486]|uniref:hypothetical protein n=1 Tax=Streptomyces sp. CA-135486 TaxID=3240049 RepID=UPI003D8C372C